MTSPRSRSARCALAAALFASLGSVAVASTLPETGDERPAESLEQLLARLRAQRDEAQEALRPRVEELLEEIDRLAGEGRLAEAADVRGELVGLGPRAALLIVEALDPGSAAGPARVARSRHAALALAELRSPAVTDRLVELARSGSPEARSNAIEALSASPEPARAVPALERAFDEETGELRQKALVALAQLGGPAAGDALAAALAHPDQEVVFLTLGALAQARSTHSAPQVLQLLRSRRGARNLDAIVAYYLAVPEVLAGEHLAALIELVASGKVSIEAKVRVLQQLVDFDVDLGSDAKRQLESLTSSFSDPLREAALALLARNGDKRARRDLLEPYDDELAQRNAAPHLYKARARLLYKIGDYRAAIRDYREALDLTRGRVKDDEPFVGIARCYAVQGDYRQAADYLGQSALSAEALRALAIDPGFRAMAAEPKWRATFQLVE